MTKTYRVDHGFDVRKGNVWFGSGLLLVVEPGESIEVYAAPHGKRGERIAEHTYDGLARDRPPVGLTKA